MGIHLGTFYSNFYRSTFDHDFSVVSSTRSYYLNYDDSYGVFDEDVVMTGAFETSIDFLTNNTTSLLPALLSSDGAGSSLYVSIETDTGLMRASIVGTTLTVPTVVVNDNTYRNIKIVRDEDDLVTVTTGTGSISSTISGDVTIRYVGSRGGTGRYFYGLLANLKAYSGGDSTTGTLVIDCAIDNYESNTQDNDADATNNLVLSGVSHTLDWTQLQTNGDYLFVYNNWIYTGVSSTGDSATITSGSTYQLDTASVASVTATDAYSDSWVAGDYSEQFTAISTILTLIADTDDSSATVSLREVLNP